MKIFDILISYLEILSTYVPLEIFTFVGSFVEEVIAPIPSPFVMVLSGSLAHAQNQHIMFLLWLAILGAIGKTFGSWILYVIADKLEDVVIIRYGKFIGVTHHDIENIGKKLNGGWQDNFFLFVARAIPIIPSAPISIACGVIKLNKKTYLTSTFAGTFLRNLMYLYFGYVGVKNFKEISQGFEKVESIGQLFLLVLIAMVIAFIYYKRGGNKNKFINKESDLKG